MEGKIEMKDLYCAYYTESQDITTYMVNKLAVKEYDFVLEPSAGEGVFIEALLNKNDSIKVDALDINADAISILKNKYKDNPNIDIRLTDTLLDIELDRYMDRQLWGEHSNLNFDEQVNLFNPSGGRYDKVIGNPPYGAWQNYDKRSILKKKYKGQYVKETYSLFLLRCISLLKLGGRLSFIIPDTFLFLNMHEKLRKIILSHTKIEEILIFPSQFFPGVSFGYSNLSIITLERCSREIALTNSVRIIKGFKSSKEFCSLLNGVYPEHLIKYDLKQREILSNDKSRFMLSQDNILSVINKSSKVIGDVADVVTGFYTGDNKKFIRVDNNEIKGAKHYSVIDKSKVFQSTSLEGLDTANEGFIPFVKSASTYKYKRNYDSWYVRWDKHAIALYNTCKKARFQNSQFYFKTGIAVPMVKSKVIRATLMENRVFDQSIVGIFPKNKDYLYYILALMNSDIINEFIHTINPTANNSSNYIKQIPFIEPDLKRKSIIDSLVQKILDLDFEQEFDKMSELHQTLNEYISQIYSL